MKATPLLFKAEMIQALLREIYNPGTGKTMTRRTKGLEYVNDSPDWWEVATGEDWVNESPHPVTAAPKGAIFRSKVSGRLISLPSPKGYAGDLIWCRETFCSQERDIVGYRANAECGAWIGDGGGGQVWRKHGYILESENYSSYFKEPSRTWGIAKYGGKWKPSIFMPRWASRITLLIEDVRVERLQDISEEDAKAEGAIMATWDGECFYKDDIHGSHKCGFAGLWAHINGADSWDRNDWVFVYSFKPILANVDAVIANPEKYGITNANR